MLSLLRKWRRTPPARSDEPKPARGDADRLIERGQQLEDAGNAERALELYQAAAVRAPDYARAQMNVAHALEELRRWDDAEIAHRAAVQYEPNNARPAFNLGLFLKKVGKLQEAEEQLLRAGQLQPDLVEVPIALADLYETEDRLDAAEAQYVKATQIPPTHPGALLNFGMFRLAQGRLEEAAQILSQAKALAPGLRDAESAVLFALNFRTDLDIQTIAARHREVGQLIARGARRRFDSWPNAVDAERKLRIGYVSGDFMVHPVALFLEPVLLRHRSEFAATYCYSNYVASNPVAARLRDKSNYWHDVQDLDDDKFIDRVRHDKIDILVDLSGHTNRNRLHAFASHPAPVQITWLGYLNTTGLAAMDYRICDWHTDPSGVEHLYTEKLLRMPDSQWCYTPWYPADSVSRPHPKEPDALLFGSFNQVAKISDACLQIWAEILRRLPHARLLVMDVRQPATGKRLTERFAQHGVESARLVLRGRESLEGYYTNVGNADIALDTFPYNGATTTLDALWMGVPVVALRGERSISRSAYSILRTLGAHDLIAETVQDYIELNVRLANDRNWRAELRWTLRTRLEASPLMDASKFTSALEDLYRDVWRSWCTSHLVRLQASN